jgi:hypothetical protein
MSALTDSQKTEITSYINKYRMLHQSPPLAWDDTITQASQNWSAYLLNNNIFQHSGNRLYGENLAYFNGYGNDIMVLLKKSVDAWYNEVKMYDFKNPGFSASTGHFTCLVWKSSTSYGIGIAVDAKSRAYIVMNTSPPGNYVGKFKVNVLPAITPAPVPVPAPVPAPAPAPAPAPVPVPLPDNVKNNKTYIINALYNIITSIQQNQPRNVVINAIYNVILFVNGL